MKKNRIAKFVSLTMALFILGACSSNNDTGNDSHSMDDSSHMMDSSHMDDSSHMMDSSDEMMEMEHNRHETEPENMTDAQDPKYAVGDQVKVVDAHMDLMKGVTATIKGAYDTTLYQVTFTPKNSDMTMKEHKLVVSEEIKGEDDYQKGDEVTLTADHMEGMQGQKAEITGIHEGPAYMIDFKPADDSEKFVNHKWVSEDEIEKED